MDETKQFRIKCRAIIIHEGKMLVCNHGDGQNFYALPGGHLEWKETPVECIEREILEELGVKAKIGRLLYVNTFLYAKTNTHYTEFFFEVLNAADFVGFEKLERTHAHELARTEWIAPEDEVVLRPETLLNDYKAGKVFSDEVRFCRDTL